jgi:hypothetical protein
MNEKNNFTATFKLKVIKYIEKATVKAQEKTLDANEILGEVNKTESLCSWKSLCSSDYTEARKWEVSGG